MRAKSLITIDPDLAGAIIIRTYDDIMHSISAHVMPTVIDGKKQVIDRPALAALLLSVPTPAIAFVEVQSAMPSQDGRPMGVTSAFRHGMTYGAILQALAGCHIVTRCISAQRWQKHFDIHSRKGDTKLQARKKSLELYTLDFLLKSKRSRVPHKGICDALLMNTYIDAVYSQGELTTMIKSAGAAG